MMITVIWVEPLYAGDELKRKCIVLTSICILNEKVNKQACWYEAEKQAGMTTADKLTA